MRDRLTLGQAVTIERAWTTQSHQRAVTFAVETANPIARGIRIPHRRGKANATSACVTRQASELPLVLRRSRLALCLYATRLHLDRTPSRIFQEDRHNPPISPRVPLCTRTRNNSQESARSSAPLATNRENYFVHELSTCVAALHQFATAVWLHERVSPPICHIPGSPITTRRR